MRRLTRFVLAILLVTAVPVAVGAGLGVVGLDDAGLGGVAAATDGTGADTSETVSPSAYDAGFDVAAVESEVRAMVNQRRANRGLDQLDRDPALRGLARSHSTDMATRGFVGHENPDGEGLGDRVREANMADNCESAGENVALGYVNRTFEVDDQRYQPTTETGLATALVEMWFNSPSHRENLLADGWERQSVGLYVTADGVVYATHLFCG